MKKYLLPALALAAWGESWGAWAQALAPAQVPTPVVAALRRAFPRAQAVQWEKENGRYEAGFRQEQTSMSALFDAAGALQEIETSLAVHALPAPVRRALAAHYPGLQVREAAKIVAARTGAVTYEAEVRQNGRPRDLLFAADGRELRR